MTGAGVMGEVDADEVDPAAGLAVGAVLEGPPAAGSAGLVVDAAVPDGFPAGGITGFCWPGEPAGTGLLDAGTGADAVGAWISGEPVFACVSGETLAVEPELSTGFGSTAPRTRRLPRIRVSERFPSQSTTNKLIG